MPTLFYKNMRLNFAQNLRKSSLDWRTKSQIFK